MTLKMLPLAISLIVGAPLASASSPLSITNPGFENKMKGWSEKDPASISSDSKSGKNSLKIGGSPGRVAQSVKLKKNTRYQLQAWVKGKGQIFINTGKSKGPGFKGKKFDVKNWTLVKHKFSSGNATSTEFGAKFTGSKDVRFDDFKVLDLDSNTPTPTPSTPRPSTPTPTPSSGCNVPHDVLPMDYWKINVPFDKAKGGSDGNSKKSAEIDWPDINSYERSPWFTNSGCSYVQFRAHAGGATTGGSGFPRTELREMNFRGNEASWSSSSGTHSMEVDLRVTKLPAKKPHVTVVQIHDGDDDVITFRLENKTLFLEIDGKDGPVATSNYKLGQRVKLKFVVSNNKTRAYYNGNLFHTHNQKYSGAYFKTGAYTQSACAGNKKVSGESCSAYAEVEIFDIDLN